MRNPGPSQVSKELMWNFEDEHFTSPIPYMSFKLKSMTFVLGEQPKIGILGKTNKPDFKILAGLPILFRFFSHSFNAIGSYFLPCSTAADENGFWAIRYSTNWLVMVSLPSWNFFQNYRLWTSISFLSSTPHNLLVLLSFLPCCWPGLHHL